LVANPSAKSHAANFQRRNKVTKNVNKLAFIGWFHTSGSNEHLYDNPYDMKDTGNLWGISEKLEDFLRKQGISKIMIGLEIACKKMP